MSRNLSLQQHTYYSKLHVKAYAGWYYMQERGLSLLQSAALMEYCLADAVACLTRDPVLAEQTLLLMAERMQRTAALLSRGPAH